MFFFCGLGFRAAVAERMLLQFLTQEILGPRAMPCRVVVDGSLSHLVQEEASALQSIGFGCMLVVEALDVGS